MVDASQITKDMEIVGSDGQHVGTVDGVDGQQIKLTKNDSPTGNHRFLQMGTITAVRDGKACLSMSAADAKKQLESA